MLRPSARIFSHGPWHEETCQEGHGYGVLTERIGQPSVAL
jgi:hypothetical protein